MDGPNLLLDWELAVHSLASSRTMKSTRYPRVPFETDIPYGIPLRAPFASMLFHLAALAMWILLLPWSSPWFRSDLPAIAPIRGQDYTFVRLYYRGQELPEIRDAGGASMGRAGTSGGQEFFHPTQVIRINRGKKLAPVVADAPSLHLPPTNGSVANLLVAPLPLGPVRNANGSGFPEIRSTAAVVTPSPEIRALPRSLTVLAAEVVPPPPEVQNVPPTHPKLTIPIDGSVVPPPPDLALAAARTSNSAVADLLFGDRVVAGPTGNGSGAPSAGSGNGNDRNAPTSIVISVEPGSALGLPAASGGSLAMSPSGRGGGAGGSGGGTSVGTGNGSGSDVGGAGPGGREAGEGGGTNPNAGGETSLVSGSGGAGTGISIGPAMAGVVISGGVVHLPSFGGSGSGPTLPSKGSRSNSAAPTIMIIASPRAGGALGSYGQMRGERVYTTYLETRLGSIVLQFSDPMVRKDLAYDLNPPLPLMTDIPSKVSPSHTIVACVMDRKGELHSFRVLKSRSPGLMPLLLKALESWRFVPVVRGKEPIAVEVLLGFGVDTTD